MKGDCCLFIPMRNVEMSSSLKFGGLGFVVAICWWLVVVVAVVVVCSLVVERVERVQGQRIKRGNYRPSAVDCDVYR